MDESKNYYVSSRGLMKSCDYYSLTPQSSIRRMVNYPPLQKIQNIDVPVIYVCSSALLHFMNVMLPTMSNYFILVSGDCDETIPYDIFNEELLSKLVNHKYLKHWFCQNMVIKHEKITCMPIGLDYHTMTVNTIWGNITSCEDQERLLKSISSKALPFSERIVKCYANFHFQINTKHAYDRKDALRNLDQSLIEYEPQKVNRLITWNKQKDYAFVISPHGGGYDCHRTWEALILGCIPIVKRSNIDILYEELPVLIVDNWSDVCETLLVNTIEEFSRKEFNFDKLTLEYWNKKFNSKRYYT